MSLNLHSESMKKKGAVICVWYIDLRLDHCGDYNNSLLHNKNGSVCFSHLKNKTVLSLLTSLLQMGQKLSRNL